MWYLSKKRITSSSAVAAATSTTKTRKKVLLLLVLVLTFQVLSSVCSVQFNIVSNGVETQAQADP